MRNRFIGRMMLLLLLTASLLGLLCGAAAAECEGGHSPVTSIIQDPGCETNGLSSTVCCICKKQLYTTVLYATGHSYGVWTAKTPATCQEVGTEERNCTHCGKTETRKTTVIPHTSQDKLIKAPTCTEKGSKEQVCKVCGMVLKANISVPALGHSWTEWKQTDAPLCTKNGLETRSCVACGKTENRTLAATGHSWSKWMITLQAGCETLGEKQRTCSRCNEVQKQFISATGHSWGNWNDTATCTTDGIKSRICKKCNQTETKESPAKGHSKVVYKTLIASTTMKGGVQQKLCGICGAILGEVATSPSLMKENTLCALGLRLRDEGLDAEKWYMFTPFDATKEGEWVYPLVASNLFEAGELKLMIRDGKVTVSYQIWDPDMTMHCEFFTILPQIGLINEWEPEQLEQHWGMEPGVSYDLKRYFGDDTNLVLYFCCRVSYTYNAATMKTLHYDSASNAALLNEMRRVLEAD